MLQANSVAPDTLFAESLGKTLTLTSAGVIVPISWLIVLGIALIVVTALAATARRSKRTAETIASRLSESEIQYARLIESIDDGIFVAGLDGVLTYANKAFCKLLECDMKDVIGKQVWDVLDDDAFRQVAAALEDDIKSVPASFMLNPGKSGSGSGARRLELDLGFVWKGSVPTAIRGLVREVAETRRLTEELRIQAAITIEKAHLCKVLQKKSESLEESCKHLREINTKLERELTEARRLCAEAEHMAVTDSVTGLYNHRYLQERLDEELKRAERYGRGFSVLMVDIDGFKNYNDMLGHMAGDDALIVVSKLLTASVRSTDIVARYGGEEFVILLLEAAKANAIKVAEHIRARIEAHSFPHETQLPAGCLTVSIGVATYPMDGRTKKDLLYAADMACYRGKREGKNRVIEA